MNNPHAIWALAAVLSIVAIAKWTAEASIEEDRQKAFMMKACADAGGNWKPEDWRGRYVCLRPDHQ